MNCLFGGRCDPHWLAESHIGICTRCGRTLIFLPLAEVAAAERREQVLA